MKFVKLNKGDTEAIARMSKLASAVVKDFYDPIIGPEQNDYMIAMFQSEKAISDQLEHGYNYYFFMDEEIPAGFIAFYEKEDSMYLSKYYLTKEYRGKGLARELLSICIDHTKNKGYSLITLNVNRDNPSVLAYQKIGFRVLREEVNDIGNGFVMDDYVMGLRISA